MRNYLEHIQYRTALDQMKRRTEEARLEAEAESLPSDGGPLWIHC